MRFQFVKIFTILAFLLFSFSSPLGFDISLGEGLEGPAPDGSASSGGPDPGLFSPPETPSSSAPGGFGGQVDSPKPGGNLPSGSQDQNQPGSPTPKLPNNGSPSSLQPGNPMETQNNPPTSNAPTFMNGLTPNQANPFLPSNTSQGLLSSPLENVYLQSGVPAIAAPLMSAVYQPFNLTFFQPNPFQVTPQGYVGVMGSIEEDTNIDFSQNQPQMGSIFTFGPTAYYSNFDDYGFITLMGQAMYYQFDPSIYPSYLQELGGVNAGTYLGNRVFVGIQDLGFNGATPQMTGSPFAFFNGLEPYYYNMANAEAGFAITPKLTFVQSVSDMYLDMASFGAGFMNIQSLIETLNYMDDANFFTMTYTYQDGVMSVFPSFDSNMINGSVMRQVSKRTSIGAGGSLSYDWFTSPALNFLMYSYYGTLTHKFTPTISASLEAGWNVTTFQTGGTFGDPLLDFNFNYTGPRLGLGVNAGEFMMNNMAFGIEMGPENTYLALGYLSYRLGPKTTFMSSSGYTYYQFFSPGNYSNNFFSSIPGSTLSPFLNYEGSFFVQSEGLFYTPAPWINTSLNYNLINFSTNIPNETVMDNQFILMVTLQWNFL